MAYRVKSDRPVEQKETSLPSAPARCATRPRPRNGPRTATSSTFPGTTSSTAPTSTAPASGSPRSATASASRCSTPTQSSSTTCTSSGRRCGRTFCSTASPTSRTRTARHSASRTSMAARALTGSGFNPGPRTSRKRSSDRMRACVSRPPRRRSTGSRTHPSTLTCPPAACRTRDWCDGSSGRSAVQRPRRPSSATEHISVSRGPRCCIGSAVPTGPSTTMATSGRCRARLPPLVAGCRSVPVRDGAGALGPVRQEGVRGLLVRRAPGRRCALRRGALLGPSGPPEPIHST